MASASSLDRSKEQLPAYFRSGMGVSQQFAFIRAQRANINEEKDAKRKVAGDQQPRVRKQAHDFQNQVATVCHFAQVQLWLSSAGFVVNIVAEYEDKTKIFSQVPLHIWVVR